MANIRIAGKNNRLSQFPSKKADGLMTENSKAFRELSEMQHIISEDSQQRNKHDFENYNADIETSGTGVDPTDFSACGKRRTGNGDRCLYSVSFRVKVSLFSLRLSFYTS